MDVVAKGQPGVCRARQPDRLFDTAIGARIRRLRLEKGISQAVLAREIGVTFQQLQKYERGENRVSAGRLQMIAEALDVPATELMESAAGPAGAEDRAAPVPLSERQSLLAAYVDIPDAEVRRGVRHLMRALADLCRRGVAGAPAGSDAPAEPAAPPRPAEFGAEPPRGLALVAPARRAG